MRPGISILLALIVLLPVAAHPCTCMQPGSPREELARCKAVFSGRVINIELVDLFGSGFYQKVVTLTVADCWRGTLGSTMVVWTGMGDFDCGVDFQLETDWLVYASGQTDPLNASLCSRTQPLEGAAYDLAQLGEPSCTLPVTPSTWASVKHVYRRP